MRLVMRTHRTFLQLTTIVLVGSACGAPRTGAPTPERASGIPTLSDYAIVPAPAQLVPGRGAFAAARTVTVTTSAPTDTELAALANLLGGFIHAQTGVRSSTGSATAGSAGVISLVLDAAAPGGSDEAYSLSVTPDGVEIRASTHKGLFYGIQTLRQLLASPRNGALTIPAVAIHDTPRFPYRGMHLDVGRHFFPADFVKRYIDLMAMYKFNTFHWHLTEDQGWRIEIKKYPRLTEVGSCRKETMVDRHFDPYVGDGIRYCGFYTQDEAREVVAYAASRYVTVIPEIEMPGHSTAALAAYPEFSCTGGPIEVATKWGVFPDIYCPKEETFAFLEDVLTEVMDIFPSEYIHIGGDEAPKTRWEESDIAQEVIRREGLANEEELQSWFVRRIERFLIEHGRRLIGWDEILEGGLAPEATVMSWRGTDGGIAAAQQGHDVIMTPLEDTYFNIPQIRSDSARPEASFGYLPLGQVYAFEPIPQQLTPSQAQHVLGAQGQVWSEYITNSDRVEYMVFPRLLALSEVVWSPASARNWSDFTRRLPHEFRLLDGLGVHYSRFEEGDR
jgi:hexosaminidase